MSLSTSSPVTLAKRSAATKEALLNATIASLVEVGFAATSTRSVAKRAGISQGALQHHFPSKADLVDAAIVWVAQKIADDLDIPKVDGANERERLAFLIDRLWDVHNLEIVPAVFEMYNMARTDSKVATSVAKLEKQGNLLINLIAQTLLPEISAKLDLSEQLALILSLMRGTVMLSSIPGVEDGYANWPVIRRHLLSNFDKLLIQNSAPDAFT